MATVRFTFSADVEEDADVVKWLLKKPDGTRSRAIVDGLHDHISRPTHADLDAKLDRLLTTMHKAVIRGTTPPTVPEDGEEPPEARQGLNAMKDRFSRA